MDILRVPSDFVPLTPFCFLPQCEVEEAAEPEPVLPSAWGCLPLQTPSLCCLDRSPAPHFPPHLCSPLVSSPSTVLPASLSPSPPALPHFLSLFLLFFHLLLLLFLEFTWISFFICPEKQFSTRIPHARVQCPTAGPRHLSQLLSHAVMSLSSLSVPEVYNLLQSKKIHGQTCAQ